MGEYFTPDQILERHIASMGCALGTTYNALWQEIAHLTDKWQQYCELYGSNPSRVELLNQASPRFFHMVQNACWETIALHVCRLTDPPQSFGKKNLSVKLLPSLIDDIECKANVTKLVSVASEKAGFCRDWRNRRYAHSDYNLAFDRNSVKPLEPATRQKMRNAIAALQELLIYMTEKYENSTLSFDALSLGADDAVGLLYIIDEGLSARVEKNDRVKRGELDPRTAYKAQKL